jgi:hypothetical protein
VVQENDKHTHRQNGEEGENVVVGELQCSHRDWMYDGANLTSDGFTPQSTGRPFASPCNRFDHSCARVPENSVTGPRTRASPVPARLLPP